MITTTRPRHRTRIRTRGLALGGAGLALGLILTAAPALAAGQVAGGAALASCSSADKGGQSADACAQPDPTRMPGATDEPRPEDPDRPQSEDPERPQPEDPERPRPERPDPEDPCHEPDPERPEVLFLSLPDAEGGVTRLVAAPADCSDGSDGTPTFTG